MPTYEYECVDCGYQFEEFQSITADPIDSCPKCAGRAKKLISAGAGFLFKGSGFYATDYRSESYKKDAKKDKGTPSDSGSSGKEKDSTSKAKEKDSTSKESN